MCFSMSHLFLKVNVQPGRLDGTLGACHGLRGARERPCPALTRAQGVWASHGHGGGASEQPSPSVPASLKMQGPSRSLGPVPAFCPFPTSEPPWPAFQVPAVEVCGLLPIELAVGCATVLRGSEALEAVVDELGVLLVEVLVRHHIRRAGIDLVTAHLRGPGWQSGEPGPGTPGQGQRGCSDGCGWSLGAGAAGLPSQGGFCTCAHPAGGPSST